MGTNLHLRNTRLNGIAGFFDLVATAGAAADEAVVSTALGASEIQWTVAAGGAPLAFITGRVPAGGFTLRNLLSFTLWAKESSQKANCTARARVFKRSSAGVESEIVAGPGTPFPWDNTNEFARSLGAHIWLGNNPLDTLFDENDRLVLRFYIIPIGVMGGGFQSTLGFNAPDGAASDSRLLLGENVAFKSESEP